MEEKKKINLTKVKVLKVDGEEQIMDVSKDLSSAYYQRAETLEEASACMDLFKTGECDYSDVVKEGIIKLMSDLKSPWAIKQGVMAELER